MVLLFPLGHLSQPLLGIENLRSFHSGWTNFELQRPASCWVTTEPARRLGKGTGNLLFGGDLIFRSHGYGFSHLSIYRITSTSGHQRGSDSYWTRIPRAAWLRHGTLRIPLADGYRYGLEIWFLRLAV